MILKNFTQYQITISCNKYEPHRTEIEKENRDREKKYVKFACVLKDPHICNVFIYSNTWNYVLKIQITFCTCTHHYTLVPNFL